MDWHTIKTWFSLALGVGVMGCSGGYITNGETSMSANPGDTSPSSSSPATIPPSDNNTLSNGNSAASSNDPNNMAGESNAAGILAQIDFENGLDHNFVIEAANSNQGQIVTTQAAHGTHSLWIQAGSGYNASALLATQGILPIASNSIWVRYYLNMTTPLYAGHDTLALASDNTNEVRFSSQFNILEWNYSPNDGICISGNHAGFDTKSGVGLHTNTWYCVELYFNGGGESLAAYLDGNELINMAATNNPNDWTAPPSGNRWMPLIAVVKWGWVDYGAGGPGSLYLDDVAIGTERIGCIGSH